MQKHIITWDLGATKCTAGLVEYNSDNHALTCKRSFTIKLHETISLEDLIHQLEEGLDCVMADAHAICIGAAGHYDGEVLLHTNPYPYAMPFAEIARQEHWPVFAVIHDYASIVCSTFTNYMQQPNNIKWINAGTMITHSRRIAFGLGTGLGLKDGVLFTDGNFWLGQNEAGHIGITAPPQAEKPHLERHKEIMKFLYEHANEYTNPAISFEKILTGEGTTNLYQFFYPSKNKLTPEEVGEQMQSGKAQDVVDAFAWYIGLFVGTVQLLFLPEGGVWITGGVAIKNLNVFDRPDFFAGINASPAYQEQRKEYPLGVLCNTEHALMGAAYYAVKRLL